MGKKNSSIEAALGGFVFVVVVIGSLIKWLINWVEKHQIESALIFGAGVILAFLWEKSSTARKKKLVEEAKLKEEARLESNRQKERERERERRKREEERLAKVRQWEEERARKEKEKEIAKEKKKSSEKLSSKTIEHFHLENIEKEYKVNRKLMNYSIEAELKIVLESNPEYFFLKKKLKKQMLDRFMFSGRLNSVLGIEGLTLFKNVLFEHLEESFDQTKEAPIIDPIVLKDLVFSSGIYYEYEYASESIRALEDKYEWRSLHRLILRKKLAKSFKDVNLEKFKTEFSKHFSHYSEEDEMSLMIGVNAMSDELLMDLKKYIIEEYHTVMAA